MSKKNKFKKIRSFQDVEPFLAYVQIDGKEFPVAVEGNEKMATLKTISTKLDKMFDSFFVSFEKYKDIKIFESYRKKVDSDLSIRFPTQEELQYISLSIPKEGGIDLSFSPSVIILPFQWNDINKKIWKFIEETQKSISQEKAK